MTDVWNETPDDKRRRAPLHFWGRADNARLSAWALWRLHEAEADVAPDAIGYGGSPRLALYEGFRREAAIALELLVKAVIAQRVENGSAPSHVAAVPMSHDLPRLWHDADLPPLSDAGRKWLAHAKWILIWSGRYPAPRADKVRALQTEELEAHEPKPVDGSLRIRRLEVFEWSDFEAIWQVASADLAKLFDQRPGYWETV